MNLRKDKALPVWQPPPPKDKGKDKLIEIDEEAIVPVRQFKQSGLECNIFYHLKKILALLNIFEALMMFQDLREALIYAFHMADPFRAFLAEINMKDAFNALYVGSDVHHKGLLLRTTEHNLPLYVTKISNGAKIN